MNIIFKCYESNEYEYPVIEQPYYGRWNYGYLLARLFNMNILSTDNAQMNHWISTYGHLPMPVSPSCMSGISAFPFRTCRSLDEL